MIIISDKILIHMNTLNFLITRRLNLYLWMYFYVAID